MKIGIITYHNTSNCGAILQGYALLRTLILLGADTRIIDYRCEAIEKSYKVKKIWELRSIKEAVKWVITVSAQKKAKKKFDLFRTQNLILTKAYDKNTVRETNDKFDAFVTGSDQVWNFNLNGGDENYILNFANSDKIKISYGASMGYNKIPEEFINVYRDNLSCFDGISLRENEGKTLLAELGFSCTTVLDPVLLLEKEDYFPLEQKETKGKYIFVYTVALTPNIQKKAKELSESTGFPVIWAHMSYKNYKGVKNIKMPSCGELLNLIKNAEYVLTSSYHGMALSVVYEKEFFYDLSVEKNNYNSRLVTLADELGLSNREIKSDKSIESYEKTDYIRVNKLKDKKKEEAISFLKKSLGI